MTCISLFKVTTEWSEPGMIERKIVRRAEAYLTGLSPKLVEPQHMVKSQPPHNNNSGVQSKKYRCPISPRSYTLSWVVMSVQGPYQHHQQ